MEQYLSSNTLALIVSTIIFVVTVALVARQLVGFLITCVMLFFAMASGVAIANNDIVRSYFSPPGQPLPPPEPIKEPSEGSTLDTIKDRTGEIFQQLVEILSNHSREAKVAAASSEAKQDLTASVSDLLKQLDEQKTILQAFLEEQHSSTEGESEAEG